MRIMLLPGVALAASLAMWPPAQAQSPSNNVQSPLVIHTAPAPLRGAALFCPRPIGSTHLQPPYPPISVRLGEQGVTLLSVVIGDDGSVASDDIQKSSGSPRLDQAAADFIKANWRWQPPTAQCDRRNLGVSISWNLAQAQDAAPSAHPSAQMLAQARRLLAAMGYAQSDELLRIAAKLSEQRIFKTINVSSKDLDKARQILLGITIAFAHQYDEDLARSLAAALANRFNAQEIESAIHFYETPPGSLIAHHETMSETDREETGRAMLVNPKLMEVQIATIGAISHIGGTDLVTYQREREAKITTVFCVALAQAHVAQSGCPGEGVGAAPAASR